MIDNSTKPDEIMTTYIRLDMEERQLEDVLLHNVVWPSMIVFDTDSPLLDWASSPT